MYRNLSTAYESIISYTLKKELDREKLMLLLHLRQLESLNKGMKSIKVICRGLPCFVPVKNQERK